MPVTRRKEASLTVADAALAGWFQERLRTSAEDVVWAVEQVPAHRRGLAPPRASLGEWPVERHAFHLVFYEETEVIPTLRHWLGGPVSVGATDEAEAAAFAQRPPLADLLTQFRALRELQITLVEACATLAWDAPRETLWTSSMETPVTARWLLTKSLQHTAEHVHNILCLALYWDAKRRLASESWGDQPDA
jgi:hypothetical protein